MSIRAAFLILALSLMGAPAAARAATDADTLIEQGHWRRARAALDAALAAQANDAALHARLAEVLQETGETEAALKEAERAVALDPRSADARYRLAEVYGEMAEDAGLLKQAGLARRFKKEAEAALALDPNHVDARFGLMVFHLKAPGIVGGDRKKAMALLGEIERLAPDRSWEARARFAAETKDTTALEGIYRDAVARHPQSYDARMALANWSLPLWRGQRARAEEQARAAIEIDPARVGAWTTLALVLAGAKRWHELDQVLDRSDVAVPDDFSPQYQAGRMALIEGGDAVRAERHFRNYLSRPPEIGAVGHAAARWRLAQALEKQGRREDAIAELKAAVRLDPKFEPARKELKRMTS